MTQAELKGNLRLPLHGITGRNGGGHCFKGWRGCIPCKSALMHWLNVDGLAASFNIGGMGCLC
jgi:hypothetical protein